MGFKDDFVKDINSGVCHRMDGVDHRPNIEIWPEEDDFGRWVASKEQKVRSVVCASPEFKNTPHCGRGAH